MDEEAGRRVRARAGMGNRVGLERVPAGETPVRRRAAVARGVRSAGPAVPRAAGLPAPMGARGGGRSRRIAKSRAREHGLTSLGGGRAADVGLLRTRHTDSRAGDGGRGRHSGRSAEPAPQRPADGAGSQADAAVPVLDNTAGAAGHGARAPAALCLLASAGSEPQGALQGGMGGRALRRRCPERQGGEGVPGVARAAPTRAHTPACPEPMGSGGRVEHGVEPTRIATPDDVRTSRNTTPKENRNLPSGVEKPGTAAGASWCLRTRPRKGRTGGPGGSRSA